MNACEELEKNLLELQQSLLELKRYIIEWQSRSKNNTDYDEMSVMYHTAQLHISAKQKRVSLLREICDM